MSTVNLIVSPIDEPGRGAGHTREFTDSDVLNVGGALGTQLQSLGAANPFTPSYVQDLTDVEDVAVRLATMPRILYQDDCIRLAAGSQPGTEIAGFIGPGTFRVVGAFESDTVTTGAASGTAGVGTTTTSVVKPTGAADYTASDLVNKWCLITGGGGCGSDPLRRPVLRPVISNTTTAFTVDPVAGMDATTTFRFVTLATIFDYISAADPVGVRVRNCQSPIELYGINFSDANSMDSLLAITDTSSVVLRGCQFSVEALDVAASILRNGYVALEHCQFSGAAGLTATYADDIVLTGIQCDGAGVISVRSTRSARVTKMRSDAAVSYALNLTNIAVAEVELAASNGGATALYMESVVSMEPVGTLITGTNNAGYGIQIEKSGEFELVGCDITGTVGDVLFLGRAVLWSNLAGGAFGMVEEHAAAAYAHALKNKAIKYGNYLFDGSVDFSSRVLEYGYHNFAEGHGLVATGTDAGTALQLGAVGYAGLGTVAAGTGVKLPAGAALPGVMCFLYNGGGNTAKVYPPAGGTVNGGASVDVLAGARVIFMSTSADGLSWHTFGAA